MNGSRCRRILTWRGIPVTVRHEDIFVAVPSRALGVVIWVARVSLPRPNPNICLPIGECSDQFLEFGVVFDGADTLDLSVWVEENAILQFVLFFLRGFVVGGVHVLHEFWVAFEGLGLPDLHYGHVAACADDVGEIEEIVACISVSNRPISTVILNEQKWEVTGK